MNKLLLFLPILAVVLLSGCVSDNTGAVTASGNSSGNPSGNSDAQFSIPLSEISSDAKWFEYDASGVKVRFFAVKAADGSIKTAFDACDVCYASHKGYRQEGDYMVCNNCGNKYPISGLGTENKNPGGCWPTYLPNTVSGNNVIIEKSDLGAMRGRF